MASWKWFLNDVAWSDFLSTKIGADLADMDPSIGALQDLDPDFHAHRKALSELAGALANDERFDLKSGDKISAQNAAVSLLAANRDPKNVRQVGEILREKFSEIEDGGLKKDDLRREAKKISPLVRYAIGLNFQDISRTMQKARKTAEALGMALKFGFPDERPVSERGTGPAVEWRPVLSVHPGQFTVGQAEVDLREAKFRMMGSVEKKKYLLNHPIFIFVGKDGRYHPFKGAGAETNDHHHLLKAAYQAGIKDVPVKKLKPGTGGEADHLYLIDQNGKKRSADELPLSVKGLVDFPERSIAWMVRKLGGYRKSAKPFAEMDWAQFFRTHLNVEAHRDFYGALREALDLARTSAAKRLPGYIGSVKAQKV